MALDKNPFLVQEYFDNCSKKQIACSETFVKHIVSQGTSAKLSEFVG